MRVLCLALTLITVAPCVQAYSVLSHEAIIDSVWDDSIKPILLARFPAATPEDLTKAHGFAYGGAIIQDMGYYPFGSHQFSDLVHYFRSGDFILNEFAMAKEDNDLDEFAFSLGSLAHYAADNEGHSIATNLVVPMTYKKIRRKFGKTATYEDNPRDHLRVEFSFDVAEIAENHYAPDRYHAFIGFEVARPLLEKAFEQTYGVPLKNVVKDLGLALGSYRRTASSIVPELTRAAWQDKKKDLMKDVPGITKRRFIYDISRSSYEKEWGTTYSRPGFGARLLAIIIRFLPKIGPLSTLSFHAPTPAAQKLFEDSFVKSVTLYKEKLAVVRAGGDLQLPNMNFDTGKPSKFGEYHLADDSCSKLLIELGNRQPDPDLRTALLAYYGTAQPTDPKAVAVLAQLH